MSRNILPPEPAEVRAERISEHCRKKGPHLTFGGKVTVGKSDEQLPPDLMGDAQDKIWS